MCGRWHVGPVRVRDAVGTNAGQLKLVICSTCQRALSDSEVKHYANMDATYQKLKASIKGLDRGKVDGPEGREAA